MVNPILFFDAANQTAGWKPAASSSFSQGLMIFPPKKTPPGGWEPGISMAYMGLPAMAWRWYRISAMRQHAGVARGPLVCLPSIVSGGGTVGRPRNFRLD